MQKGKLRSLSAGFVPSAPRWTGREKGSESIRVFKRPQLSQFGASKHVVRGCWRTSPFFGPSSSVCRQVVC